MADDATTISNASTIQTTTSGNRSMTSGGRGNFRNRNNRNANLTGRGPTTTRSTFKGNTLDMNGHVFECHEERGDRTQFPKTLEVLGEYAAKNLKHPEDLKSIFEENMTAPKIEEPPDLPATPTKRQEVIWEASLKSYSRRVEELRSNLTTLYAVIWGQCSEAMRTKIRALDNYNVESHANNCTWLLNEIKGVTHQFDTKRNIFLSLLDARIAYYTCKQLAHQTNAEYLEIFRSNVEVLEYYKANIGESYLLIDNPTGRLTTAERTALARGRTIAIAFIRGSDQRRYSTLLSDLANQKTRGNDQYPTDLTAAYSMLVNYHAPGPTRTHQQHPTTVPTTAAPDTSAYTFAQATRPSTSTGGSTSTAASTTGSDGVLHAGITCFNCQASGHYANSCPKAKISLLQYACVLAQTSSANDKYKGIPNSWILLDSQLNISVFNNKHMISNIRRSDDEVCAYTNGGTQTSTFVGDFHNLGTVWYNPDSIANILSLSEVRKHCKVTMDTSIEPALLVHRKDGSTMVFREHQDGLYVYDTGVFSDTQTLVRLPARSVLELRYSSHTGRTDQ
jgi:Zinc knuckle